MLDAIWELVRGYAENSADPMFAETIYIHPQNGQEYPMFVMNRDGRKSTGSILSRLNIRMQMGRKFEIRGQGDLLNEHNLINIQNLANSKLNWALSPNYKIVVWQPVDLPDYDKQNSSCLHRQVSPYVNLQDSTYFKHPRFRVFKRTGSR